MGDPVDMEQLYNRLASFVAESRKALVAGDSVKLAGLDGEVAMLCAGVAGMPREQAVEFMPRLEHLLADINALGDELRQQRDAIEAEIQGLDQHKKAATAYTKHAGDTPKDEE